MRITVLALVLLLSATGLTTAADKRPAIKVYVFTSLGSAADRTEEEKERLDAVREMRDAVAHKKGLTVVDEASQADVRVEVVNRETRDLGDGGFGGRKVTPLDEKIIRLHATWGDAQSDIKGIAPGYWGRAAKDAADRLQKWAFRIAEQLPARKSI
jgi:hypothetical protein